MHCPTLATAGWLLSQAASQSLDQVLSQHSTFSILQDLLHQHKLIEQLSSTPSATFFAMTNNALLGLADFGINLTTADPNIAKAIFEYAQLDSIHTSESVSSQQHEAKVVRTTLQPHLFNNVTKGQAAKLRSNQTADGRQIVLETGLGVLTPIVEADIAYDNGVIHAIDANMVLPHNISETARLGGMNAFLQLLEKSDSVPLMESLSDVTVFIPQDEAIAKIRPVLDMLAPEQLASVVAQHAVPNHVLYQSIIGKKQSLDTLAGSKLQINRGGRGEIFVDDAQVVRTDLLLYGGVAHLIDAVLLPVQDDSVCIGGYVTGVATASTHLLESISSHQIALLALGVFALVAVAYKSIQSKRRSVRLIGMQDRFGKYEKV